MSDAVPGNTIRRICCHCLDSWGRGHLGHLGLENISPNFKIKEKLTPSRCKFSTSSRFGGVCFWVLAVKVSEFSVLGLVIRSWGLLLDVSQKQDYRASSFLPWAHIWLNYLYRASKKRGTHQPTVCIIGENKAI